MGLQNHVDDVIREKGCAYLYFYEWKDNHMVINADLNEVGTKLVVDEIMTILDGSGGFGPTRYDPQSRKIEFGVHSMFFPSKNGLEYQKYCDDFKRFKIDKKDYKRRQ